MTTANIASAWLTKQWPTSWSLHHLILCWVFNFNIPWTNWHNGCLYIDFLCTAAAHGPTLYNRNTIWHTRLPQPGKYPLLPVTIPRQVTFPRAQGSDKRLDRQEERGGLGRGVPCSYPVPLKTKLTNSYRFLVICCCFFLFVWSVCFSVLTMPKYRHY